MKKESKAWLFSAIADFISAIFGFVAAAFFFNDIKVGGFVSLGFALVFIITGIIFLIKSLKESDNSGK